MMKASLAPSLSHCQVHGGLEALPPAGPGQSPGLSSFPPIHANVAACCNAGSWHGQRPETRVARQPVGGRFSPSAPCSTPPAPGVGALRGISVASVSRRAPGYSLCFAVDCSGRRLCPGSRPCRAAASRPVPRCRRAHAAASPCSAAAAVRASPSRRTLATAFRAGPVGRHHSGHPGHRQCAYRGGNDSLLHAGAAWRQFYRRPSR